MSYNVLKGSVEFIGSTLGQIEDIVNTHNAQRIKGAKTFTNITASGGVVVNNALEVDATIRHLGDTDTKLEFPNNDELTLVAGNSIHLYADSGSGQKKLVLNESGHDIDLQIKDGTGAINLNFDANLKSFAFGNHNIPDDSVFVHLTSSVANASLLSVGQRKHPILAVSGAAQKQDWKVKVDGLLTSTGNIQSSGVVTGSLGIQGELLNIGTGLHHLALAGQKKLSVKASTTPESLGIVIDTSGLRLSVTGLTEEGSINSDSAQPDWLLLTDNDGAGNYINKKQKVSTILANTAKSTMANLGADAGGGLYTAFNSFAADGRTAQFNSLTTPNNKLLSIAASGPNIVIQQAPSPFIEDLTSIRQNSSFMTASHSVFSGSIRHEIYVHTITTNGQNVSLAARDESYQIFNAAGAPHNCTASLPQITENTVGKILTIKHIGVGPCLVTGSAGVNQKIDGAAEVIMSGGTPGAAKFKKLLAFKIGASGYEWAIVGEN